MAPDEVTLPRRTPTARWFAAIPVTLGLAVGSLLLFAWLSEAVLAESILRSDENIRTWIHQYASPDLTAALRVITNFGDWQVILTGSVLLLLVFWYLRNFDFMRLVAITMTGAGILDGSLKTVFHRARPDPFFIAKPDTYSFPSGHALVSLCFYGLLAGIVSLQWKKRWQRALTWTLAACIVGIIGFSRIYLGVHWPSDVLAGYAAALMWMGAVRFVAFKLHERQVALGEVEAAEPDAAVEPTLPTNK